MKKLLAVILAATMLLSFAACGKNAETNDGSDISTEEPGVTAPAGTPEEIIDAVYAEKSVSLNLMTTAVDLEDEYAPKYNLGLDDVSKVKEAAVSEPMMGSQAYSFVLIRLKDAADAEDVANAVIEGIDPRKWICVEADDVRVMTKGDVVALYMVGSQFGDKISGDTVEKAFTEVVGGSIDKVIKK